MKDSHLVSDSKIVLAIITKDLLIFDVLYSGSLAMHHVRRHTFVPHVTVGRVRSEEIPEALEATAGVNSPIEANIETIAVYAVQGDGVRPVLFELELL